MTALVDAALAYAARGWDVFPCHTPTAKGGCSCGHADCENQGKHPRVAWKANATTNPKTIAAWWKQWPSANIGIATGARSGLVVLDVDGADGAATVAERGGTESGPQVTTGRGQHRYLAHPGKPVKNFVKRDGLDLRGDGGYVIAPPSLHWRGGQYTWNADTESLEPPPMPGWLLAMLAEPEPAVQPVVSLVPSSARTLAYASVALENELIRLEGCANGTRNKTLNEAALKLGHIVGAGWLTESSVENALLSVATKIGLPAFEATATIRSGITAGRKKPTVLEDRPLANDQTFGLNIGGNKPQHAPPPIDWQHHGISASDLQSREFAELNWPVANILSEGCTLLAGKPKSKKSWLALGLAIDIARGQPTLGGLETKQGRVLYLDLESNQRRMQSRIRAMLGKTPWPQNLHIFTSWPRGEDAINQLDEWMVMYPDTIFAVGDILKNLRPLRQKNANPYDEDYEAVQPFNAWAERHRVGMMMLHHTRKAKADDVFDEISGSTGLSAGVAGMWVLGRMPNSMESVLAIRGRDIILDDDMALAWDEYSCRFGLTGTAEERSLSQERRNVLDVMSDRGEYTPKELATLVGKPVNSVVKLLTHLFADHLIEKVGYGKYVKVMGRNTYGLVINPGTPRMEGMQGTPGTQGTVPKCAQVCPPDEGGGHTLFDASQSIKQPVENESVPSVPTILPNAQNSGYDHDKQRMIEVDHALVRHDYKAARRAAQAIRGRKDALLSLQRIDEAEKS